MPDLAGPILDDDARLRSAGDGKVDVIAVATVPSWATVGKSARHAVGNVATTWFVPMLMTQTESPLSGRASNSRPNGSMRSSLTWAGRLTSSVRSPL